MNINELMNAILASLLPVLVASMTGALIVWAKTRWDAFKSDRPDLADILARYAKIAVEAAEQALQDNGLRKEMAMNLVYAWLERAGLGEISQDLVEAEIERQVGLKKENAKFYPGSQ
jgi:hypothetical protein